MSLNGSSDESDLETDDEERFNAQQRYETWRDLTHNGRWDHERMDPWNMNGPDEGGYRVYPIVEFLGYDEPRICECMGICAGESRTAWIGHGFSSCPGRGCMKNATRAVVDGRDFAWMFCDNCTPICAGQYGATRQGSNDRRSAHNINCQCPCLECRVGGRRFLSRSSKKSRNLAVDWFCSKEVARDWGHEVKSNVWHVGKR